MKAPDIDHTSLSSEEQQRLLDLQQAILESVAGGVDHKDAISRICKLGETLLPNSVATVMLMDDNHELLNVYAAPSVPPEGGAQLNGLKPGPGGGSCGNVIYRQEPQFVSNTYTDDRWCDLRQLAYNFNLCSCWSVPIFSGEKKIIGTFALSSFEHRSPSPFHRKILEIGSSIIGIVLERNRAKESLTEISSELVKARALLQQIIDTAPIRVFWKDRNSRYLGCNPAFARDAGKREPAELTGRDDYAMCWAAQADHYRTVDKQVMESEEPRLNYEEVQTTPDNTTVWLRISKMPLRDEAGNVFGLLGVYDDITERKHAEELLRESEARYRRLVEKSPDTLYVFSSKFGGIYYSNRAEELLGYSLNYLHAHPFLWKESIHPDDQASIAKTIEDSGSGNQFALEYRLRDSQGNWKWVYDRSIQTTDKDGEVLIEGLVTDITERKRSEERLNLTARVFANTLDGILITDKELNIVEINASFTRITGYSRDEVIGKNPRILESGQHDRTFYAQMWESINTYGHWVGEIWDRRKNGEVFPEMLTISTVKNELGAVVSYVGVFSDITHIKQHQKQLEHAAHYDALTGIPNRLLLASLMKQALAHAKRSNTLMAVCYLDLDGFKPINDSFGHDIGDKILIEVARRIEGEIRGDDTVARLGGDEFVILLVGIERTEECAHSLNRLLATIGRPIEAGGRSFSLSASIGLTLYPIDDEDADTLLRHADQAMYIAKQSGKNRHVMYDFEYGRRFRARQMMLEQISNGLAHDQFELYFQPKVNMRTRNLTGAEALIRWHHPERGLLPPAEFLHALEGTDLDILLGEWVIDKALNQLEQWQLSGLHLGLGINISAHHLQSPDFSAKLKMQLAGHPELPQHCLQIEILETAALEDMQKVTTIIDECRSFGVSFALDDFGTGYSSLTYLSSLPVNTIKIDQSFVRNMLNNAGNLAIVRGIIALAKTFGLEVVAEGIETADLYQKLLGMGCEIGQGYGIARPMPAIELSSFRFGDLHKD